MAVALIQQRNAVLQQMKVRSSAYFILYKTKLAIHIILYNTQDRGRDAETLLCASYFEGEGLCLLV